MLATGLVDDTAVDVAVRYVGSDECAELSAGMLTAAVHDRDPEDIVPIVARSPCRIAHIARITGLYGVPRRPVARQGDRVAEHQHTAGRDESDRRRDHAVALGEVHQREARVDEPVRPGTEPGR
ncbi:hypothetical protein [Streptomyces sp. NBC_01314]|uniref:hypothetical protein n=1 Tax=Streptomyces sp. NBC_01314 TaxID=2903821 RepID=UPI00352E2BEA